MIGILRTRLQLGHQTVAYPSGPARFPDRFRGRPLLDATRCVGGRAGHEGEGQAGCAAVAAPDGGAPCAEVCPTQAVLDAGTASLAIDLGACLFCGLCQEACPGGAITFSRDYRLAMRTREELLARGDEPRLARALDERMRRLFGRSLRLRQVSAGGCNGCEAELNATGNVQFDLGRFGVQFVASPRHADGLLVTGPVTENMRQALQATWEATPAPRLLIAAGACAISGGPFAGSAACHDGLDGADLGVPVDLYIPGCPPHPITILDGLLRLLGRVEGDRLALAGTGVLRPEE